MLCRSPGNLPLIATKRLGPGQRGVGSTLGFGIKNLEASAATSAPVIGSVCGDHYPLESFIIATTCIGCLNLVNVLTVSATCGMS